VSTIAKGAATVLAGTAAVGVTAWAVVKKPRQRRVLGVPLPRGLGDGKINPKKLNVKTAAKHVSNFAERVEQTSDDVRATSAQVKRVTRRLS
jgi:hypothetical protein